MSSRAKTSSKSKRSGDKRERASRSNETENDNYEEYNEAYPEQTSHYDEGYEGGVYGTYADKYENDVDVADKTPRSTSGSKRFKHEEPSTSYGETPDEYDTETIPALKNLAIDDGAIPDYADETGAQEEEAYDVPSESKAKGKKKATADIEEEEEYEDYAEHAESAAYDHTSKQVAFAEEDLSHDYPEESLESALEASKRDIYSSEQIGESSTAVTDAYNDYAQEPYDDGQAEETYGAQAEEIYGAQDEEPYDKQVGEFDPLANAPKGPRISTPKHIRIADPQYRRYRSADFCPGAVFKTMWSEPMGAASRFTTRVAAEERGKLVHVSARRFIIVGKSDNQSYCVPIFTYGKQGCKKNGVKPHRHGMVYSGDYPPEPLKNEPELGFDPVRVYMDMDSQTLLDESRVNYSILCTVQHNVKALFIGYVDEEDFENIVQNAVYGILDEAMHKPSKQAKDRRKGK